MATDTPASRATSLIVAINDFVLRVSVYTRLSLTENRHGHKAAADGDVANWRKKHKALRRRYTDKYPVFVTETAVIMSVKTFSYTLP
ncbi:hypothetical protein FND52_10010 [Atlantibacter subterranea]|nr:hypothetical protein FND52_10010 [Atlantibacter subterranea]